ncbi:MAG: hypothetical protein OSJ83_10135, partial [Clostridia bacterium]|nr:hypothetical protein [Clostridia bacterium]
MKKKTNVKHQGGRGNGKRPSGVRNGRTSSVRKGASARQEMYSLPTVTGLLDCKGDRFGFIADALGDVFVSGRNLVGARHGDTVRAVIIGDRAMREGRRREGRIIEIVERNPLNIVATVTFRDNVFYALPDDRHYGECIE